MSKKCWAACLGECDDKISREHIISDSFFEGTKVHVEGFNWCLGETKTIRLSALTKKCLCKKHNNALSVLDSAAAHAATVFREQNDLSLERNKDPNKKYRKRTFWINASLLERWLLKSLINISFDSNLFIGVEGAEHGVPAEDLVNIVYGGEKFSRESGMKVVSRQDMRLKFSERIEFAPMIHEQERIIGGIFIFWGLHIYLDLTKDGLDVPFELIRNLDPDWHFATLHNQLKRMNSNVGGRVSHEVLFRWPK